jgi:hypothetical protein
METTSRATATASMRVAAKVITVRRTDFTAASTASAYLGVGVLLLLLIRAKGIDVALVIIFITVLLLASLPAKLMDDTQRIIVPEFIPFLTGKVTVWVSNVNTVQVVAPTSVALTTVATMTEPSSTASGAATSTTASATTASSSTTMRNKTTSTLNRGDITTCSLFIGTWRDFEGIGHFSGKVIACAIKIGRKVSSDFSFVGNELRMRCLDAFQQFFNLPAIASSNAHPGLCSTQ